MKLAIKNQEIIFFWLFLIKYFFSYYEPRKSLTKKFFWYTVLFLLQSKAWAIIVYNYKVIYKKKIEFNLFA